jgi:hypothetical protein
MECVHTHPRILVIEGWGSPSYVQSVVEKTGKKNQKIDKID